MWQKKYNSELYHHGVKGMKWGVRRARKSVNPIVAKYKKHKRAKELAKRKEAAAKARVEASKKKPAELTEKELKERIERLELEKKYADLMKQTNPSPSKKEKGKKIVEDILTDTAKNIGKQTTALLVGMAVNKALEAAFNEKNMINPKKGQKDK